MKKDIHPKYQTLRDLCLRQYLETRSTKPEIRVSVCSNCHPFYTGKRGILVTEAGQLENSAGGTAIRIMVMQTMKSNVRCSY